MCNVSTVNNVKMVALGGIKMVSDCLETEVDQMLQDDEVFVDRMAELKYLRRALLEQKNLNFTLKEQLKRATKIQLNLEATLNEMDEQLQQQFDDVSAIRKQMFSRNVEIGLVTSNNRTAFNGSSNEHVQQRHRYDEDERSDGMGQETPLTHEDQHEQPNHLGLASEHSMQFRSPLPKKKVKEAAGQSKSHSASLKLNSPRVVLHRKKDCGTRESKASGSHTQTVKRNHSVDSDDDNHEMKEIFPPPSNVNRKQTKLDGSKMKKRQVHSARKRSVAPSKNVRKKSSMCFCQECGKQIQRASLPRHLEIHTGKLLFECEDCGAAFLLKGNLTRHVKIHSGGNSFKCSICNVGFRHRTGLSAHHRKFHADEKPPECDIDQRSFTQKKTLSKHNITKSADKFHQCKVCETFFSSKSNLLRHHRLHVEGRMVKVD